LDRIVIIGGGDFAKKLVRLLGSTGAYDLLGYTDYRDHGDLYGAKYLGDDSVLPKLIAQNPCCCAAIGFAGNLAYVERKLQVVDQLTSMGFGLPTIISPRAQIAEGVEIDGGTVVFDEALADAGAKIGPHCVLNLRCLICHDSVVGAFATISPSAVLGGGSTIGQHTFVGMNATINPYVNVGDYCVIGSGAVVTRDCPQMGTYIGNPARIMSE